MRTFELRLGGYLLFFQVVISLLLTGLIWTIQVVHYPLFAEVGEQAMVAYARHHQARILWLVAPLMLGEMTAATLFLKYRPTGISLASAVVGMGLVLAIWLSTAIWQVPAHETLATGYDAPTIHRLIDSNWVRTIAWSVRSVLLLQVVVGRNAGLG